LFLDNRLSISKAYSSCSQENATFHQAQDKQAPQMAWAKASHNRY